MLEDRLLIWRLKHGSTAALEHIYEKYLVPLTTVASSLLHDPSSAEDAVHDAFVAFARSTDRLALKGSLRAYLATCVLNKARDQLRSKAHQGLPLETAGPIRGAQRRPDEMAALRETRQRIGRALMQLPAAQREAIVLHLQAQMSFRQIAEAQDVSINTVMSQYRYGLQKLRSLLNGELEP